MRLIVASLIRGAAPQNPRSPVRRHEGIFTQLKRKGSVNFSEATKFTVRAVTSNKKNLFRPQWTLGREGSGHRPRPPNDAKFPCLRCGLGWGRCPAHSHASPTRERGNPRPSAVRRAAFPCWRCGLGWGRVWMGRSTTPLRTKRSGRDQRGEVLASSRFTPKRRKKPIKINGVQKCRLGDLNPDGATVRCVVDEHAFACLVCCRYHIS